MWLLSLFLVFIFLVFVLLLVTLLSSSLMIYWGVFFFLSLVFSFLMRLYRVHMLVIYNYVTFQEVLGYMFLLSFNFWFPIFFLFLKLGIPPLHFWVIFMVDSLPGYPLLWFLTYYKLVFLPILVVLLGSQSGFLFCGLFVLYLQMYQVSSYRSLMTLLSLESFSWLSLLLMSSLSSACYIFLLYFFMLIFAGGNLQESNLTSLSFILTLMNFPLSLSFFLKYTSLCTMAYYSGVIFFFPSLLLFCSVISSFYLIFCLILTVEVESTPPSSTYGFLVFLMVFFVIF